MKEDIDCDSPWVKRLGWVRHFGSRDLISIHDAAQWLWARAATGRWAQNQEDEEAARERLLLSRLGQSFDREVDRCCWRLDSVPTETLQWLGSIISMTLIKHVEQKCAAFPLLHQSESPFFYSKFPLWKCAAFPSGSVNREREMRRVSSTKARANHVDDRALRLQSV